MLSWESIQKMLRYVSLDQRGGLTNRLKRPSIELYCKKTIKKSESKLHPFLLSRECVPPVDQSFYLLVKAAFCWLIKTMSVNQTLKENLKEMEMLFKAKANCRVGVNSMCIHLYRVQVVHNNSINSSYQKIDQRSFTGNMIWNLVPTKGIWKKWMHPSHTALQFSTGLSHFSTNKYVRHQKLPLSWLLLESSRHGSMMSYQCLRCRGFVCLILLIWSFFLWLLHFRGE